MMMDYYGKKLQAFKAMLHTHTTRSDGSFSPQEAVDAYAELGYDILALTDHHITSRITEVDPKGMLLIPGAELHPYSGRFTWHFLCLGLPENAEKIGKPYPEDAQEVIDQVRAWGGLVFCAHPRWCGAAYDEIMSLRGLSGIEVANSSCRDAGRVVNEEIWDTLCDFGAMFPALGVDDMHSRKELDRNWTVILAESRSEADIMKALRTGSFYATQGPQFRRLSWKNGIFEAEFTESVRVNVIMRKNLGRCFADPDDPDRCTPCTSLSLPLRQGQSQYVRVRIEDAKGRVAWSNPLFTGGFCVEGRGGK